MYQSFKPKTEGIIFAKRSMPQYAKNSPHDTTTSFVKLAAFGTYKTRRSRRDRRRGNGKRAESLRVNSEILCELRVLRGRNLDFVLMAVQSCVVAVAFESAWTATCSTSEPLLGGGTRDRAEANVCR